MRMKKKTSTRKTARRKTARSVKPSAAATAVPAAAGSRRQSAPAKRKAPARRAATAKAAAAPAAPAPAARKRVPRKTAARPRRVTVPPILLEGDYPAPPSASGPGGRYVLGPTPPAEHFVSAAAVLPEAYGTKRLFLAARDPQWLYAHWDLTREQQQQYNNRSVDGHLVLRVYVDRVAGAPFVEMHVHPESRHWFVHVGRGGTKYLAELGYYRRRGAWTRVSVSEATLTPHDTLAEEMEVAFATLPVDLPLPRLLELVRQAALTHAPLAVALEQLRAQGHPALPRFSPSPPVPWTPEQERALAEIVNMDAVRRVWVGSLEITELIRRQHLQQLASPAGGMGERPTSPGVSGSVTSPFGGAPAGPKGFWFNINAELIIYGATEPDATVNLGGRPIKLRPDGSFSYRFALPDGHYELPAVAVSADQTDGRAVELTFSRMSACYGDVGVHPQDPTLRPPTVDAL
jgi:hypothetical protein